MTGQTIIFALPEILLIAAACGIYVVGAFLPRGDVWRAAALAALGAAIAFLVFGPRPDPGDSSVLVADSLGWFLRLVVLAAGALFVLLTVPYGGQARSTDAREQVAESLGSLLLIVAGLMLLSASRDLVLLFAGLELVSIPTYVLLYLGQTPGGMPAEGHAAREASAKYFFLSILSSALLLYGLSFLYGLGRSTDLGAIAVAMDTLNQSVASTPLMARIALVLIFAGLGFRLAAAPFHFYAPDVYQGTTSVNAGLLSVMPKVAAIAALIRLTVVAMPGLDAFGWRLALVMSVLTMTIGNVVALWQDNLRRLLAYSSIANGGYLLIGIAAAMAGRKSGATEFGAPGIQASLVYLTVYGLATTALFAGIICAGRERAPDRVDELAGLASRQPWTAIGMAVALFSLAGIPPLAGFWGKFELFTSATSVGLAPAGELSGTARGWFVGLAVVGVLNAAVACAYYLRLVAVMFFQSGGEQRPRHAAWGPATALATCTVLTIAAGLAPGILERAAAGASRQIGLQPAAFASKQADNAGTTSVAARLGR